MVFKDFRAWDVLQAGFVAVSLALCPAVGTRAPCRVNPWNQECFRSLFINCLGFYKFEWQKVC